jgi:hypothetical protein
MWICGSGARNTHETGIVEEIMLDNLHRNPTRNFSIWDSLLYEKARFEPNITLLLNCSCTDAAMVGKRIRSVTGWQLTTQTWHTVEAALFADCSGDSILAPLTGAEYRVGREARREFGESIEPEEADRKTMGMSCLIQARETNRPQPFIPPPWANVYRDDASLPNRDHGKLPINNAVPELTRGARPTASEGDPEPLRNGSDRPVGDADNGWTGATDGGWVAYTFDAVRHVRRLRFVFDGDLNRNDPLSCHRNIVCSYPLDAAPCSVPPALVRAFRIEVQEADGVWRTALRVQDNHQRLVRLETDVSAKAIRFVSESTWGAARAHLFAWDVG